MEKREFQIIANVELEDEIADLSEAELLIHVDQILKDGKVNATVLNVQEI